MSRFIENEQLETLVATARAAIADAAPDEASAVEGESYLARVLSGHLADLYLRPQLTASGLTRTMPIKGAPNPDYLIFHAPIDPSRRYRINGWLNSSERIGIGLYRFDSQGAAILAGYKAFDHTTVGSDGVFALELAPKADAADPALKVGVDVRVVIVRVLHRDPAAVPAHLMLTGANGAALPPPLPTAGGEPEEGFIRAARMTLGAIRQFLTWSSAGSARPNQFFAPPPEIGEQAQGDPDTTYFLGYYALASQEHLEIEIPAGLSGYWSVHAYNHWCEPLPGAGIHDRNAVKERGGQTSLQVGPTLGVAATNPIDTLGRCRGMLIFRAIGASPALQAPTTRLCRST